MKPVRPAVSCPLAVALAVAGLLAALTSCSKAPAPRDPAVLAKVGVREIRVADVQREIKWRREAGRNVLDPAAVLNEMVAQEVLCQQAKEAGLESDFEVQRALRSALAAKFKEQQLKPRLDAVTVSEAELAAEYEKDHARLTRPAKVQLALIEIKTSRGDSEAKRAGLRQRIEEARQKALELPADTRGFGALAVTYSEDAASRYRGGDIGWFEIGQTNGRFSAPVLAAGMALQKTSDLSEVVETPEGLYLLRKLDSREAMTTPLEQVRESLRRRLLTSRRQAVEETFQREVRGRVPVELHLEGLAALPAAPTNIARTETAEPPALPR